MAGQILFGTMLLSVCTTIHLVVIVFWVHRLRGLQAWIASHRTLGPTAFAIGGTLVVIVLSHSIQVWLIAAVVVVIGALSTLSDALYFSLVTYTTVGYGDITLEPDHRIFGAMASVTGLLNFGISTAVLVAVVTRVLRLPADQG
ncbi:MAG: potassium channel family protein [Pseudomonadota bacterium]